MFYYTFKELFEEQSLKVLGKVYYLVPEYAKIEDRNHAPNIDTFARTVTSEKPAFVETEFKYVNTMFRRLVNKWINNDIYFTYSKKELTDDEKLTKMRRLLDTFADTYGEYVEMIKRFESLISSDIPSYITSENETRFNDTPLAEADYGADKYTSSISKIISKTGIDTIERYKQVQEVIEDIYSKWERNFIAFQFVLD